MSGDLSSKTNAYEGIADTISWLLAALQCGNFRWDADQHAAATDSLNRAKTELQALRSVEPSDGQWAKWRADLQAIGGWDNELVSVPAGAVRAMIEAGERLSASEPPSVSPMERALQLIMVRLADLLNEDQFNNIEAIAREAGARYPDECPPGACHASVRHDGSFGMVICGVCKMPIPAETKPGSEA